MAHYAGRMPLSRRSALALLALGVTGCAGSPVIVGDPATAPPPEPEPPEPTRSTKAEAAHRSMAALAALIGSLVDSPHWEAQPWAVAARAQCEDHVTRLALPEPLEPQAQEPFPMEIRAVVPPSDATVAVNRLTAAVAQCVDALEEAAGEAEADEVRLLYTSMSTAVLGLHEQSIAPVEGEGAPRSLQPTTVEASLPILLGHVWALIYGLGVGLGRIDADDPLHALGTARLNAARTLRNDLRARLGADAPEQPAAFDLPTPMDNPEAVREAWGQLEVAVMNGYARLVAADADPQWRIGMRNQVVPVQATGTALTWWPGWLA